MENLQSMHHCSLCVGRLGNGRWWTLADGSRGCQTLSGSGIPIISYYVTRLLKDARRGAGGARGLQSALPDDQKVRGRTQNAYPNIQRSFQTGTVWRTLFDRYDFNLFLQLSEPNRLEVLFDYNNTFSHIDVF